MLKVKTIFHECPCLTQKLSIYGDKEYMKEQKLIPYPASSLLIITSKGPEEEAGPLPSKVNLDQSDI